MGIPSLFRIFALISMMIGLYALKTGQYTLDLFILLAFSYWLYKV